MEYKQVIVVRKDIKLPKGKLASQVAHASVAVTLKSNKKKVNLWLTQGMKKSILKVDNLRALKRILILAEKEGLVTSLIKDAGRTVFKTPTVTCLGIGPDHADKIDAITGKLKLI